MQFDRKSVDRMLNMEDNSLQQLIAGLARNAGLDQHTGFSPWFSLK